MIRDFQWDRLASLYAEKYYTIPHLYSIYVITSYFLAVHFAQLAVSANKRFTYRYRALAESVKIFYRFYPLAPDCGLLSPWRILLLLLFARSLRASHVYDDYDFKVVCKKSLIDFTRAVIWICGDSVGSKRWNVENMRAVLSDGTITETVTKSWCALFYTYIGSRYV